jgi:RNA-directed DNA polymerase
LARSTNGADCQPHAGNRGLVVQLHRPNRPHYCTRSRKWGSFVIGRKTIKKRLLRTLEAVKVELRKRMHDPIVETGTWVWQMLNGRLNYFAVSGNDKSL